MAAPAPTPNGAANVPEFKWRNAEREHDCSAKLPEISSGRGGEERRIVAIFVQPANPGFSTDANYIAVRFSRGTALPQAVEDRQLATVPFYPSVFELGNTGGNRLRWPTGCGRMLGGFFLGVISTSHIP